jgi:hypothetical protein
MRLLATFFAAATLCLGCKPPASSHGPVVVEEKAFNMRFPPGWFRETVDAKTGRLVPAVAGRHSTADHPNTLDFAALDGSFFHIEVDPPGHGYCADAEWTVRANGAAVEVVEEESLDRPPRDPPEFDEEGCYENRRTDTLGIATQFDAAGHSYFMLFGNRKQKRGNDLAIYRGILATFKAK